MLEKLRERLQAYAPRHLSGDYPRAAVLMAIIDRPTPSLLLTLRAVHLSTHAGQVAFPGGKFDPEDQNLQTCALREAHEEIALPPDSVKIIGQLSDRLSLHGMAVTPFVGIIPDGLRLTPNPGELDEVFEVPLTYLFDDRRHHTDVIVTDLQTKLYVPSYDIGGRILWGLSAMMVVELLAVGFALDISLEHPPKGSELRHPSSRQRITASKSKRS
ncbi:CoA pyrophosphatase [Phytohalomonas tamaricis]|uniref:CoA pyrophosphatase n=1 Tax=Phytohalomonas tamaricis TaxID=2081032 RepID=UPI000D0BA625|nr:CoA pyrophosphatase [Phytohalomonas tamaricis]